VRTLTRSEAEARADLLEVASYDVALDVTTGESSFASRTTVRFACRQPGAGTFVDFVGDVHRAELNGRELPVPSGGDRIALHGLAADNVLTVEAQCPYSRTGEGLHRFVDPVDGAVYLYAQSFLLDGSRIFACFEQPDLKATFDVRVNVPPAWEVVANGAPVQRPAPGEGGTWRFARTPPISTYLAVVAAGPFSVVRQTHDGLDLGLYCRASLARHLEADELFEVTRAGFDFFHALFGVRYPFGDKYDQLFVPEFNAGAMENPAAVTFRDEFVFRSAVSERERLERAMVVLHEMAHMWFGDLVTMRWWNDLWLNESFATYLGFLATAEATRFSAAWTEFCATLKTWGYARDQLPSTHPVSTEVADTASALLNFDGISYAKGASILKQLAAWVGRDALVAGLRSYFVEHAYANTTLADLLRHLSAASGRDLTSWAALWLQTSEVNTLSAEFAEDSDGRLSGVEISQSAPDTHPVLRPHRLALGLYDRDGSTLVRRAQVLLDVAGARTPVPELTGSPRPDLLLVNDDDLTYAKIRFDPRSLATVLEGLTDLADPLARALCWAAVWDATRDGELPARSYVDLVCRLAPREPLPELLVRALDQARTAAERYAEPAVSASLLQRLADISSAVVTDTRAEPGLRLVHARAFAATARTPAQLDQVRGLLAGQVTGLPMDPDLRWPLLRRLVVLGAAGPAEIDAELARDPTAAGEQFAAGCRAAQPTAQAKQVAWRSAADDTSLSNRQVEALAQGFWQAEQVELCRPYADRYFARVPGLWRDRSGEVALQLTRLLYPALLVEPDTLTSTERCLADPDLPAGLVRKLRELAAEVSRGITARARDTQLAGGPAGQGGEGDRAGRCG